MIVMSCRMDSDDNQPCDEENITQSSTGPECKKRKGRGSTRLPDVIKDRSLGVKKVISYDDKGRPTGKNRAKLSSYLGVLARTMVPLSHKDWSEVPNVIKERLWCSVLVRISFLYTSQFVHQFLHILLFVCLFG